MSTAARRGLLAVAIVALGISAFYLQRSQIYLLSLCCVYLMATMGLNLTMGYAGQMSLGQAAFFGIGAYITAILVTKTGMSFWATIPIAAVACFVVGLALGFPALRVQHHYLAFATLGFNVLVYLVMRNEEALTGGTFGIANIPRPSILGLSFDSERAYFWLTLASLTIVAIVMWLLLRSPWGRAFAALRDNPIRAESLGINITAYTLLAFAIGAAYGGVGGVFYAGLVQYRRARHVLLRHFADDAAGGDHRRQRALLRTGNRHHRGDPAAGSAALEQPSRAAIHAEVVPGGVRHRAGRADGLAAGRPAVARRAPPARGWEMSAAGPPQGAAPVGEGERSSLRGES